jgi:hypothetical protein
VDVLALEVGDGLQASLLDVLLHLLQQHLNNSISFRVRFLNNSHLSPKCQFGQGYDICSRIRISNTACKIPYITVFVVKISVWARLRSGARHIFSRIQIRTIGLTETEKGHRTPHRTGQIF